MNSLFNQTIDFFFRKNNILWLNLFSKLCLAWYKDSSRLNYQAFLSASRLSLTQPDRCLTSIQSVLTGQNNVFQNILHQRSDRVDRC